MKVIYNNQIIKVPSLSLKHHLFLKLASTIINFGPIFSPVIFIVIGLVLNVKADFIFIGFFTLLLVGIYWLYIVFINFYNVKVNKFVIKNLKIKTSLKIVFVSDLHLGAGFSSTNKIKLKKIIQKINSLDSDYVILGGDILDTKFNVDLLILLGEIKSKKIAVFGNHDSHYLNERFYSKETPKRLIESLSDLGFEVLVNSGKSITQDIYVGGIKDLYTLDFDIDKSMNESKDSQFKILISHNPDIISYKDNLNNAGVNLILSGHNHAGQIKIGNLHLPLPSLRQWLIRGIYSISDKTTLLLSQGVGTSHIRTRIGTEFEICEVNLEPSYSKQD